MMTETAKPVIEAEAKARTFYRRCGGLSATYAPEELLTHLDHGERSTWSPEESWSPQGSEDGGQDELARLYALLNDTSLPVDGEAGLSWWSDSDLLAAAAVGSGSTKGVLVELLSRYSNRLDLLEPLHDVLRRIEAGDRENLPGLEEHCSSAGDPRRVCERLTGADIHDLLNQYRAGVTMRELAEQYGISHASVKRILARHGVRRRPKPPR